MKTLILLFSLISATLANTLTDGKYAIIDTNQGEIIINLAYKKAPLTVINFSALAMGLKNNKVKQNKPFYDGLKFHRVIDNFMVQGGDPKGNGSGGPGYKFVDEITDLKHDRSGTLSMANSGLNTNGSQFFITHTKTPWLDGKHTVFGYVVKGMDIVNKIKKGDAINTITIKDVGLDAKNFITNEAKFQALQKNIFDSRYKKKDKKLLDFVTSNYKKYTKVNNYYRVIKKSNNNKKVTAGDLVEFDLGIYLSSGTTIRKKSTTKLAAGRGRLNPILEKEMLQLSEGSEIELLIPYYAIYGNKKSTNIADDEIIIFNLELKKIN